VETLEFTLLESLAWCGLDCGMNIVTRFTEASGAATNIEGLFATVIALIDNKVCSMLLTMGLGS
jgi:hypothetical protein